MPFGKNKMLNNQAKNMNIYSPITNSTDISFIKNFEVKIIIDEYKNRFNIDVSNYFIGLDFISLYKCNQTELKFFSPLTLNADEKFYKKLQEYPWYYLQNKWEYDFVLKYFKKNMNVLEIGSGEGYFLKMLKETGIDGIGLEQNENAIEIAKKNGLKVVNDPIEEYSQRFKNKFDVVCSFQVMEHVYNIKSVIESSLALLKDDGILIICVPNNNSFIGKLSSNVLNMPPHHLLLWNEQSLKNLTRFFNIKILNTYLEPLQEYHYSSYYASLLEPLVKNFGIFGKAFRKFTTNLGSKIVGLFANKLIGHSVIAIYQKLNK